MGLQRDGNASREPRSAGWHLIVLVLSCLLPAAAIIGGLIWSDYVEGREYLKSSTMVTSRELSAAVDQQLRQVQAGLVALATSPLLAQGDLTRFHAQAQTYLAQQRIALNVVLIDRSGTQVLDTQWPVGTRFPEASPVLLKVASTGRPEVTDLFEAPLRKRLVVAVGVPVSVDASVAYTLAAVVEPATLRSRITGLSADWRIVVADRNANIVARSHAHEQFIGQQVAAGLAASMRTHSEASLEEVTRDGVKVIAIYSRAPFSGWTVAVGVPVSELLEPLRQRVLRLAVVTFLLLGACLALAWFMSGRIRQTVHALAAAARQLGDGAPVILPPLRFREAFQVGEVLVAARESLQAAHEELKRNELRLSMILDSAKDAIVVTDASRRIVRINRAATRKFIYATEEILLQPVETLVAPQARSEFAHALQLARDGVAHTLTAPAAVGLRSNGDEFPMEASVSAVVIDGELFHTLIVRDISLRVATEAALAQSNLDLQQFAYVAAHDLRSPLRSIHGFVELLAVRLDDKLDASSRGLFERIERAVDQMSALTEDLLSFARLNHEPRGFVDVDLDEVVKNVLLNLGPQIAETHASVGIGPLPVVSGDPTQLTQLVQNLVGNALKYSGKRPPDIDVRCKEDADSFTVSVSDKGIGIDPQYHARIFEVFKRLHTQREIPGSGIGLAICKRVVENHQGRIWVDSQPGAGSTFHFTLPKSRSMRHPGDPRASET